VNSEVWEHKDSLTKSPNRVSPEVNTNAQRIFFGVISIALTLATLGNELLQLSALLLIRSPGTLATLLLSLY